MTAQEIDDIECAIRHIQTAVDVDLWARKIAVEAMEKEISALQEQDSPKPTAESAQNVQNEDIILRKAAIEAMGKAQWAKERLMELPSAQPETAKRIVGKSRDGMTLWYQCDMCNEPVDAQDDFCRGCGRRLTDG